MNLAEAGLKAYEGNEKYAFISYSHKDSDVVAQYVKALQEHGSRLWFDEGIEVSEEWPAEIERKLTNANFCLVFYSKSANDSQNVRDEINYARNLGTRLFICYIEETELTNGMGLRIGNIQSVFLYKNSFENNIKVILKALRAAECCEGKEKPVQVVREPEKIITVVQPPKKKNILLPILLAMVVLVAAVVLFFPKGAKPVEETEGEIIDVEIYHDPNEEEAQFDENGNLIDYENPINVGSFVASINESVLDDSDSRIVYENEGVIITYQGLKSGGVSWYFCFKIENNRDSEILIERKNLTVNGKSSVLGASSRTVGANEVIEVEDNGMLLGDKEDQYTFTFHIVDNETNETIGNTNIIKIN